MPPRVLSYVPPQTPTLSLSAAASGDNDTPPRLPSSRRVQIYSPDPSPCLPNDIQTGALVTESATPVITPSAADSHFTGAESDDAGIVSARLESKSSPSAQGILARRTRLRRNAYPPRYVKRSTVPSSGNSSPSLERRHLHSPDAADLAALMRVNVQYVFILASI